MTNASGDLRAPVWTRPSVGWGKDAEARRTVKVPKLSGGSRDWSDWMETRGGTSTVDEASSGDGTRQGDDDGERRRSDESRLGATVVAVGRLCSPASPFALIGA